MGQVNHISSALGPVSLVGKSMRAGVSAFGFFEHFTYGSPSSTTADLNSWLNTADTYTSHGYARAEDDIEGGAFAIATDDDAGDHNQIQLNGEWVYPAVGRIVTFETRLKLKTTTGKWFAGIAVNNTDGIASAPADYIGFGGTSDADLQYGAGVDSSDTSVMTLTDISAAVSVIVANTFITLRFVWDGVSKVYFYVDDVLKVTLTSTYPCGATAEYMAPCFIMENGGTVEEVMTIDYVGVFSEPAV